MTQTPSKPQIESQNYSENGNNQLKQISKFDSQDKNESSTNIFQSLINKFYNLSIGKKQLLVLLLAQTISIGALVGIGIKEIVSSGRNQLVNQSESELKAKQINYGIKINQMGFGFRGQSDNTAIIEGSLLHSQGQNLPPVLSNQIRDILKNEIQARNIEYATLVGRDRRIIVNANKDRTGQIFDPNGLVSKVISKPEQIKTTEIVTYSKLSQEQPPIFPNLTPDQDGLIRYTVTPVKDKINGQVIGVLVSGDLVNNKFSIVEDTINLFGGGYAGIYMVDEKNQLILVSSLTEDTTTKNKELADKAILEQAIEKPDQIVTSRGEINGKEFTFTAQAIRNNNGEVVGILVRGTSEKALAQNIRKSLNSQSQIALLTLLLNLLFIVILNKVISERIKALQGVTQEFARGNQNMRANIKGKDEIGNLADNFNEMAQNIQTNDNLLRLGTDVANLLQEITSSITLDQDDVDNVFNQAMAKIKLFLSVDRIVVYRFNPGWSGYISHESYDPRFPSALKEEITDPCIPQELRNAYVNGRIVPTEDVLNAGFSSEHLALMQRLKIKANLVVPILNQSQLFGLLIAHDCQSTRKWSDQEKGFMNQIAIRFGIILDRVSILKAQINAARRSEQLKEITLFIASGLNRQEVLELSVREIQPAMKGDRVIIYEFDSDWQGTITAEAVVQGYPKALGSTIKDPCFAQNYVKRYTQGRVQATSDIYNAGLTPCHLKQLEPFEVKANLVAPILVNRKLIGLLICHQCSGVRNWDQGEIELFTQLATQVGLGLERVNLLESQKEAEQEQRLGKEKLQQRALELLMEVDPVSQGDLTIRASVTEDEIGTIADSYNATIESLRKIVSQVQLAAIEVTETTNTNELEVSVLQEEISEQAENIALALDRIDAMSKSSSMVAESAEQAEEALQKAQENVEKGDLAMNKTVQSILEIRSTVQAATIQVKKLGETTQKISSVVNLIGGFAAQTHLLALKASIEAARAGEEGQGFAVIANEVRTLATQSAEATADIEKLVSEIQSETHLVVSAMEEGTDQVIEGSKLVEETRQSLNQITAATLQVGELVEVIAAAAFEQSENSEEVSEKMSDVATIAEKTRNSVGKLSDSFRNLLEVAKQLEANMSQFKV